ncbi:MAG: ABC transporter permease, partial [Acidimicrobiia bacterium]|nr:ABC transporter permease [Acidimicrobiia bacterium]
MTMTAALAVLALPVAIVVGLSLGDLATSPLLRRLAVRNLRRRPGEAALAVLGSMLGTAVVCSAFVVGDTLDASLADEARTQHGPIDEAVVASGVTSLGELEGALANPVPGSDGALSILSAPVVVTRAPNGDEGERRASPRALLHEVDVAQARAFGGDEAATGFAGIEATPDEATALVGRDLAEDLDARRGDRLQLFLYGRTLDLEVAGFVPRLGVAGFYPGAGSRSPVLFVPPGTLAEAVGDEVLVSPPLARVLVSNEGGVLGGAEGTDEMVPRLQEVAAGVAGARIEPLKADVLDQAEAEGSAATRLLGGVGAFSVLAGVLLLVNVFVLLVEERRVELGALRALGLRRGRLVRALGLEGGVYALAGAAGGAGLGVLIGKAVVGLTAELFASGDAGLELRFSATWGSVLFGT